MEENLPPLSAVDQEEALRWLSEVLGRAGFRLLALGSTALVVGWGVEKTSKDVDVHAFPVGRRWEALFDALTAALDLASGHVRIEPDGASMTAFVPTRSGPVPVEIIEGREDFISPRVLADATRSARQVGAVFVPSAEHLLVMKAEAYADRTGPARAKFAADLLEVAEACFRTTAVNEPEVGRLVQLRPARKRDTMARAIQDALATSQPVARPARVRRPPPRKQSSKGTRRP